MSDPPRLHTEPESQLERSLLDAGRSYTASTSSRTKALAALGVVGITASSASGASAVTKAGLAKWLALSALLAGAAVSAVHFLRQHAAMPISVPSAAGALTENASSALSAPVAPPTPTTDSPAARLDNPTIEPTRNNAASTVRPDSKAPPPAALAAELRALDAARSSLASGDASGALTGLDAYARNFPHGKLSLEAEVLRIDALAKSGQTAAARKHAEAFVKRHPDSVLASRVRAYAGQ